MSRFTLVVRPDGRAMLTTTEAFDAATLEPIREALDEWIQGRYQVGVLTECEVIRVTEIEVDLEARLIRRAEAS